MNKTETHFKRWCVEHNQTAEVIAQKTGISQRSIYSYMQGTRYPSRRNLKRLEEVYGVSMREVFPF